MAVSSPTQPVAFLPFFCWVLSPACCCRCPWRLPAGCRPAGPAGVAEQAGVAGVAPGPRRATLPRGSRRPAVLVPARRLAQLPGAFLWCERDERRCLPAGGSVPWPPCVPPPEPRCLLIAMQGPHLGVHLAAYQGIRAPRKASEEQQPPCCQWVPRTLPASTTPPSLPPTLFSSYLLPPAPVPSPCIISTSSLPRLALSVPPVRCGGEKGSPGRPWASRLAVGWRAAGRGERRGEA
ncbi:hypothetical protein E2C01_035459 [Portunus trituberculatus]|uniref:Uncharacterized protein n=1 Tax=Portunus trituberculatus TaxID=210409 RepID=A0A5B7F9U0_PORTR|nr:hypothetical protein [Portunus trituberculatus]